jgi:hypothetical protein
MNKNKGEEPTRVIIHIYMEISQGSSLYLKQAKMSFFSFSFIFYKIGEQEGRTGTAGVGERMLGNSGRGR